MSRDAGQCVEASGMTVLGVDGSGATCKRKLNIVLMHFELPLELAGLSAVEAELSIGITGVEDGGIDSVLHAIDVPGDSVRALPAIACAPPCPTPLFPSDLHVRTLPVSMPADFGTSFPVLASSSLIKSDRPSVPTHHLLSDAMQIPPTVIDADYYNVGTNDPLPGTALLSSKYLERNGATAGTVHSHRSLNLSAYVQSRLNSLDESRLVTLRLSSSSYMGCDIDGCSRNCPKRRYQIDSASAVLIVRPVVTSLASPS